MYPTPSSSNNNNPQPPYHYYYQQQQQQESSPQPPTQQANQVYIDYYHQDKKKKKKKKENHNSILPSSQYANHQYYYQPQQPQQPQQQPLNNQYYINNNNNGGGSGGGDREVIANFNDINTKGKTSTTTTNTNTNNNNTNNNTTNNNNTTTTTSMNTYQTNKNTNTINATTTSLNMMMNGNNNNKDSNLMNQLLLHHQQTTPNTTTTTTNTTSTTHHTAFVNNNIQQYQIHHDGSLNVGNKKAITSNSTIPNYNNYMNNNNNNQQQQQQYHHQQQHNFVVSPPPPSRKTITSPSSSSENLYQQQPQQQQSVVVTYQQEQSPSSSSTSIIANNNNQLVGKSNYKQPIMMVNRTSHQDTMKQHSNQINTNSMATTNTTNNSHYTLESNNHQQLQLQQQQQWNQSSSEGVWNPLVMSNSSTSNQYVNSNNAYGQPMIQQTQLDSNFVNDTLKPSPQNDALITKLLSNNLVKTTSSDLINSSKFDTIVYLDDDEEENETQYHPIACQHCRKVHKRDKKLPSCTRCSSKGLKCVYKEPFFKKVVGEKKEKKKRKQKGNIITMFNVADENEIALNAIKSIKQNTIETYCSIVCMGNPPFKQEDLEQLLLLVGPQELLTRRDVFGFLLSIQALCELKFGYPDLAEETMTRARNTLSHHFDDYENPFIVCTYGHLAFFTAAEGKSKLARGYLSFVNHYINDWKQSHSASEIPHGEISGNLFQCSLSRLNWMSLLTELISTETHPVPNISTIEKISLEMLGLAMPDEWKDYLTYYQLTDSRNVDERLKTLELFGSLLHFAMGPQNNSVFATRLHSLNNIIVINGIRATVLLLSGCNVGALNGGDTSGSDKVITEHANLLEYAALAISKTTDEEFFPFISPYLISFFLLAVKVNLEICRMIDRGERENYRPCPKIQNRDVKLDGIDLDQYYTVVDYYSVVAKDLRGLQVLRKRYRYIAKYVTDLEEFLAKRTNQSLESIAYFVNSSNNLDLRNNETNKTERIGTFYNEMRKFMLTFNKGLGEALLGNQARPRAQDDNMFTSHPALSMVMSGAIKPGNVNELSMYVSEMSKNVKEQADALRDLSTPSSIDDIELDLASTLDPFQAHSSQF